MVRFVAKPSPGLHPQELNTAHPGMQEAALTAADAALDLLQQSHQVRTHCAMHGVPQRSAVRKRALPGRERGSQSDALLRLP